MVLFIPERPKRPKPNKSIVVGSGSLRLTMQALQTKFTRMADCIQAELVILQPDNIEVKFDPTLKKRNHRTCIGKLPSRKTII